MEPRQLLAGVTESFPLPNPHSGPIDITTGPDGNLWFTESNARVIGMINPATHAISEFPIPAPHSSAFRITARPDGNLWFTQDGAIGVINPTTHAISEFPIPAPYSSARDITAGPDGNLWFTQAGAIGVINPRTYAITELPLPSPDSSPTAITAGPDGNLWFIEDGCCPSNLAIGMVNPTTRVIAEFPIPRIEGLPLNEPSPVPRAITAGPDGNLWFTESVFSGRSLSFRGTSAIGIVDPTTHRIDQVLAPTIPLGGITAGPDGNLWFVGGISYVGPSVFTINPTSRTITSSLSPGLTPSSVPEHITAGPDGNLWCTVTSVYGDTIGVVRPSTPLKLTARIVGERLRTVGQGRSRRVVAITLRFSAPLDPTSAGDVSNYLITRTVKAGRRAVAEPLRFQVAYQPSSTSVTLVLAGASDFGKGGKLVVNAVPPRGLKGPAGVFLSGLKKRGVPGQDGLFTILPKGRGIIPQSPHHRGLDRR